MLAIGSALLAAMCFALASALQHHSAARSEPGRGLGLGLLGRLLRHPRWLIGLSVGAIGLLFQAFALSAGQLVLVQPLLVSGLLFALPFSVLLDHRRPTLTEWAYAAAVIAGLTLFLTSARPQSGTTGADQTLLAGATASGATLAGLCVLLARAGGRRYRPALLGIAGGLCTGMTGALLKQVVDEAGGDVWHILALWPTYALAALGLLGIALAQSSYQAGSLAMSLPALTIAEPLVAVGLGAATFGETLATSPLALTGEIGGFALMSFGVLRLAAQTPHTVDHRPTEPRRTRADTARLDPERTAGSVGPSASDPVGGRPHAR